MAYNLETNAGSFESLRSATIVTGETLLDGEEEEVDDDDEKDDDNIESDAMIKVGRMRPIRFISRCNAHNYWFYNTALVGNYRDKENSQVRVSKLSAIMLHSCVKVTLPQPQPGYPY
jgi:hypothetical protein